MIFVVEGNIGVGKTTLKDKLISHLKESAAGRFRVVDLPEPVDRWVESGLLQNFYNDPEVFGFVFQSAVISDMFLNDATASRLSKDGRTVVVAERSLVSTTDIFVPLVVRGLRSDGDGDRADKLTAVAEEFTTASRLTSPDPTNVIRIYMRCEPVECMTRISTRNRDSEKRITMEYLQRLHELHDLVFGRTGSGGRRSNVELDASSTLVKTAPMSVTCFGDGTQNLGDYVDEIIEKRFK